MELMYLLIGLILGFLLGFLAWRVLIKNKSQDVNELIKLNTVLEHTQQSLQQEKLNSQQLKTEYENRIRDEKQKLENEINELRKNYMEAHTALEKARTHFANQEQKIKEQKEEIENLHKKLSIEFENIANKILEEKTQKFTEQNKINLDTILIPLKERIKDFENKVEKHYNEESKDKASLREQIKQLHDLNQQMSKEAQNLTKALKGDNKTQGNWGEMILESILEKSGLVKNREYKIQESFTNEQGKRYQPDVLITLPDNKNMIIDSKVSLVAYEQFVNTEREEDKNKFIKEHINSLKQHIKGLSEKNYQNLHGLTSLDFVLLFIPIEPAFALAVQNDNQLFNDAFDKNIVLVSPSTLLATLRTVANIWRYDNQNKNALEIARLAGSLYDKISGFAEDMKKIKEALRKADENYEEALKKLVEGKGNVINTAVKIRELGAKSSKQLPQEWIDKQEE